MSSEPKSPKPMPSVAEINAYLEQSAARTRMRLPLAKGNALPVGAASPAPAAAALRGLPVRGKALPTERAATGATAPSEPPPEGWTPFSDEPE